MNFVAIDVETANPMIGSICQIGLAKYIKGKLIDTYETLLATGANKSTKHLKAEELMAKGHGIQIATEQEFMQLINSI